MIKSIAQVSKTLRFGILIAGLASFATGLVAWQQISGERRRGQEDLDRRAGTLLHRVVPAAQEAMTLPDAEVGSALKGRLDGHRRLLGFAVFRPGGRLVTCAPTVSDYTEALAGPIAKVLATHAPYMEVVPVEDGSIHILANPLRAPDGSLNGVMAVLHDASYLDERVTAGMARAGFWVLVVALLVLTLTVGLTWAVYERPLHGLAEWMRRLRMGNAPESPPVGLPVSRLASESEHLAASFRAARSSGRDEAREIVRADRSWTRERLRAHALESLGDRSLLVVSNREPYMHQLSDGQPRCIVPASGVVTALDPVLQACGGLWIAHGAGDADRMMADANGRLTVPPGDSRYTLRRMWLSREEEQGYYYGLSNEGLWPLCHLTHERPVFRASDWESYVSVNRRFADAVIEEVGSGTAMVLVQDYQLALVPGFLRAARPNLKVGLFWHIPWPNPEAFRICPYRAQILEGMLGADLMGFHLQQHCNNFLDTVDRMVEARLDWDRFSADFRGHTTLVQPFPISVQNWSERTVPQGEELARQISQLKEQHHLDGVQIGVGVDRIDYTKGLAERFHAIERFFARCPQHRGKFTFVQLGAPSRTHIRRYRELIAEMEALADSINWSYQTDSWKPIRFLVAHHEAPAVHAFFRMASVCVVSSLHDGMNLVAKEFVSAQEDGVLVLSEFAGAARELSDAIIVNPYDTDEFAEAIRRAVEMDPAERRLRMSRMRAQVEEHNIYRWASAFLSTLSQTHVASPAARSR